MRYLIVLVLAALLQGCFFFVIPLRSSEPAPQPAQVVTSDDSMDVVWERPGASRAELAGDVKECQLVLVPADCMRKRGYSARKSTGGTNVKTYEAR
jgi:hypothetical protein